MSLSRSQKGLVEQLRGLINCTEKVATDLLRAAEWSVDRAANEYFERGAGGGAVAAGARGGGGRAAGASASIAKIDAEFTRLQDPAEPGVMNGEQVMALCSELGVDPESDIAVLVMAFHMGAKKMGIFTKDEFRRGFTAMGVETVAALKTKVPSLRDSVKRADTWRAVWSWAYDFNCEEGQKSVKLEVAQVLTPLLLTADRWALAPAWVEFLAARTRGTVSRDTWNSLPRYIDTVKGDVTKHRDEDGWPVMFDEFIEWMRKRTAAAR